MIYKVKSYDGKTEEIIEAERYSLGLRFHNFYNRFWFFPFVFDWEIKARFPRDKFYVLEQ